MKKLTYLFLLLILPFSLSSKIFNIASPDKNIIINVDVTERIQYQVSFKGTVLLEKSPISMTLSDGNTFGIRGKLQKSEIKKINTTIEAPIYKRSSIPDIYNELTLKFKEDYNIVFRAYNDGIAYRFVSTTDKPFTVESEEAAFNFPKSSKAYVGFVRENGYHDDNMTNNDTFENQFFKSFVNVYEHISLTDWKKNRLAFMPLLVEAANGVKICLTESDLIDYPGMYLNVPDNSSSVKGVFAPYPKTLKQGGKVMYHEVVTSRENYIAKYEHGTSFPWRTLIIADKEYQLLDNDMVYKLASPTPLEDVSWIKPGKAAWEWWNDCNLYNVDFKTGVNNETYKKYIDFASKNKLEYILMDEGWYEDGKIMEPIQEINLKELVEYGRQCNVGIILWTGCYPFKHNLEEACKYYSSLGIKGFKVDFFDRDDQLMVNFHYQAVKTASRYHLIIDFHGTYKPTGLQRTYPNTLNFEAVQGLEHMKWAAPTVNQVEYDVTMPYIRMIAGPLDYTQGAMHNANRKNYKPVYSEPMSQGTRARQMAEYVVFESPLSMLCDSPTNYEKEQECVTFISGIPSVWDDSKALNGEVTKHITIARRKDSNWYVGSINNWDAREMKLNLSFLGEGNFTAEIFKDGINADKVAQDYKHESVEVPANREMTITLAPGGGFIMKISKK